MKKDGDQGVESIADFTPSIYNLSESLERAGELFVQSYDNEGGCDSENRTCGYRWIYFCCLFLKSTIEGCHE